MAVQHRRHRDDGVHHLGVKPLRLAAQAGAVALVVGLLGLLVWKVAHDNPGGVAADFNAGKKVQAVDFTLGRLNGKGSLSLSSLRGRVVVLNFWAAWCDPCKSEAPRFQSAFERYRRHGVAFVGLDVTDYSGDARAFLARYGITYPNVRDQRGSVLAKYGGLPIPRTYVVARSGRVVSYIFGEARPEAIDSAIKKALTA
ncbi:MAG: TlpA family protein disulfide reductase [Actinobacteria bacterium]|nr:MAG: TlpA family protein disulfide reductase [Actinomycetota bacterium]